MLRTIFDPVPSDRRHFQPYGWNTDVSNQHVGRGIRVNAVAPGPVWTPLVPTTMADEALKSFTAPMGRPAQPSEIATCFVFLASMDSSAISGQTLHLNGGVVVNG